MHFAKLVLLLAAFALSLGSNVARAQDFPSKSVRLIVGFSAGGINDTMARIVAQKLTEIWGQPVIVENRVGASGTIGADFVAKAPPDGHTLLAGDIGPNAVASSLYKNVPYDLARDFVHIARLITYPLVIVVPVGSPMASLKDLISQAKAKPGSLRYSSAGVGSGPHLFPEMLNQMAEIKTEAIQYKGSAPAVTALLSGDIEYTFSSVSTARAQLQDGKVKALAVTSAKPIPSMSSVPPIATEVLGYEALNFVGLHGPAKTPAAIVTRIHRDVATVMRLPDMKQRLDQLSIDASVLGTEEYTAFIRQQINLWAGVIKTANIRGD